MRKINIESALKQRDIKTIEVYISNLEEIIEEINFDRCINNFRNTLFLKALGITDKQYFSISLDTLEFINNEPEYFKNKRKFKDIEKLDSELLKIKCKTFESPKSIKKYKLLSKDNRIKIGG